MELHVFTFSRLHEMARCLAHSVAASEVGVLHIAGAALDRDAFGPAYTLPIPGADYLVEHADLDPALGTWGAWRKARLEKVRQALRFAWRLPPGDLMLYVDGSDVLLQPGPAGSLAERYLDFAQRYGGAPAPVVYAGMEVCFPFEVTPGAPSGHMGNHTYRVLGRDVPASEVCARLRRLYGPGAAAPVLPGAAARPGAPYGPFYNLDSGVFMGRAASVRLLLGLVQAALLAERELDEQAVQHLVRLEHPELVAVDTWAEMFRATSLGRAEGAAGREDAARLAAEFRPPLCGLGPSTGGGACHFRVARGPRRGRRVLAPRLLATNTTPALLHFVGASKFLLGRPCCRGLLELRSRLAAGEPDRLKARVRHVDADAEGGVLEEEIDGRFSL